MSSLSHDSSSPQPAGAPSGQAMPATSNHPTERGQRSPQAAPAPAALRISGLRKSYGDNEVVRGLSLIARAGQITAVLGPNGAGKTTTIECCEGLRAPDGGQITLFESVAPGSPEARSRVGVMLQDGGLPSSVRSIDMLRHVAKLYLDPWDIEDLVERLGIESFAKTQVRRLSGGQRQRLSLAAALVGRPELVFLDEPSAGMDPQSRHAVWELIRSLRDGGTAVVLTTHLMDEAESLSDQVYIVDHGQVIAQGSPAELTSSGDVALTFECDTPVDVPALESALSSTLGTPYTVTSPRPLRFKVSGDITPASVAALAAWLNEHGVMLSHLTSGSATLEDVFLDLTGRTLR
ncbi:ABC transporter ATP-binding protein [Timonella senegalensis]|uniref:ABC transporter ATP-binding protein n=1 Tax=Timonella senegalensis TaxID=1465825 RepID=UPI0028A88CB3|nr:ABC transporter ATP-binding protein [Timonella senegalensis]